MKKAYNVVYEIIEEEQLKMFKVYNTEWYKIILGNRICARHIERFKNWRNK